MITLFALLELLDQLGGLEAVLRHLQRAAHRTVSTATASHRSRTAHAPMHLLAAQPFEVSKLCSGRGPDGHTNLR